MSGRTLEDLNNHLFASIEALGDEDLGDAELDKEIKRARALRQLAAAVIEGASLALEAQKFADEAVDADRRLPMVLLPKSERQALPAAGSRNGQ